MANPVTVDCPVGEWTPVALAVQTGMIKIHQKRAVYFETYRDAGDPPPTDREEGIPLMQPGGKISSGIDIDVYIWAEGDLEMGSVRADLE